MKPIKYVILICCAALIIWYGISAAKELIREKEFSDVYRKAISGDVREQFRLAQFYNPRCKGRFVEKDDKEALYWYVMAAGNGDRMAKEILCQDYKIECPKEGEDDGSFKGFNSNNR